MRKLFSVFIFFVLTTLLGYSQKYEWIEDNTSTDKGERVVAVIDAGSIGAYDGVEIVGEVIDNNGNWGYNLPTVANFRLYVKFSGEFNYDLVQDVKTRNLVLGLKRVSPSEVNLVANCQYSHMGVRVNFCQVEGEGAVTVTMGDPNLVVNKGEYLMSKPKFQNFERLVCSGKIGIGVEEPSAKLDVAGNIKAEEIEVTLASMDNLNLSGTLAANQITVKANGNTADFVFSDTYNLKDLTEVENYIKINKHLPDIPSAEEMEASGVNLAEMNKLLLQKVEELTLYIIKQDEKLTKQDEQLKEITNLKSEIKTIKDILNNQK